MRIHPDRAPAALAASAGGALLAGGTRLVAAVRPTRKPLHPRGRVSHARLDRQGLAVGVGVSLVDDAGVDDVVVRQSRAVGLPSPWPDVHGLALRMPVDGGGHADLLLATTGWGRRTRHVLTFGRTPEARPMTTLLPYRSDRGSVLLGARATGGETWALAASLDGGPWQHFADLRTSTREVTTQEISFDPARHPVPGLEPPDWVRRLRAPAYDAARRARRP